MIFSFIFSLLSSFSSSLFSLLSSSLVFVSFLFHLILPCCLVSSSLSSCLVSLCLLSLSLSLSSFSVFLSLSLSPSDVVCVVLCMSLWSWCVRAVWCGTLKTRCVHSKRPRVYRHHARIHTGTFWMYTREAFWKYTRREGWREGGRSGRRGRGQRDTPTPTPTHTPTPTQQQPKAQTGLWPLFGAQLRKNTFCQPKFAHVGLSLDPRSSIKKLLGLTHFELENRSRTICSRFLRSFALPDKIAQLQLSWGTLRRESATGWFDLSYATCTSDTFHDVRSKEPLTFHNGFMIFATFLIHIGLIFLFVIVNRQGHKNISTRGVRDTWRIVGLLHLFICFISASLPSKMYREVRMLDNRTFGGTLFNVLKWFMMFQKMTLMNWFEVTSKLRAQ